MISTKTSNVLRGIAILMVIGSHYAGWMYTESFNESFRNWISTWGVYGVDIFFVLSGYGLVKSADRNGIDKRFVARRILNSYVPYILITGFFSILDKSIDSKEALVKLVTGYDFWYMFVLFAMYIMFMVIYKIGWFKEILLTVCVIAFTYLLYIKAFADFWELSNGAFLIGVYAATLEKKFGERIKELIIKSNLTMISFALMIICAFWHVLSGSMSAHMTASMLFSVMTVGFAVQFTSGGFVLPVLGRYSLYIYLLHARLFWKFVAYKKEWSYLRGSVTAALITLSVSVALGFCIEYWLGRFEKKVVVKKES